MDTELEGNLKIILAELYSAFNDFYNDFMVQMFLYGSQARGDAHKDSDIDILILLDGEVNPFDEILKTGEIVASISLKYNTVINCIFMSEKNYTSSNTPFLRNIRRENNFIKSISNP